LFVAKNNDTKNNYDEMFNYYNLHAIMLINLI